MNARRAHPVALALSLAGLVAFAEGAAWAQSPQPSPTPAEPASPYDPSMKAGGLAPPPPMDPTISQPAPKPPDSTEQSLDEAKREDSKRGLSFFWLNAEGGFEYVDLQLFNIDEKNFTAGFLQTKAQGPVVGAGVGAQLLFLTLGARGRLGFFEEWQLFSVGGEIGFRIPIARLEPHIEIGGGYEAIGNAQSAIAGVPDAISIRGFYVRAGGGLDYFVHPKLSLGANVSAEFTALTRPGVSLSEISKLKSDPATVDAQRASADLLSVEGSGYGLAFAATGVVGLHF